MNDTLMTVAQLAVTLQLARITIYKQMEFRRLGKKHFLKLDAVKMGRLVRFRVSDVARFIERGK